MADATITVSGNLTRAPEYRQVGDGGVCNFSIAVNKRAKKDGEWVNEAAFWNVSAWDQLGTNAYESLDKGMRVTVTGVPHIRSYETKDGNKGLSPEITASDVAVSLRWSNLLEMTVDSTNDTDVQRQIEEAFAPDVF